MGQDRATKTELREQSGRHQTLKRGIVRLLTCPPVDRMMSDRPIPYGASRSLRLRIPRRTVAPGTAASVFFGVYEPSERRSIQRGFPKGLPVVELGSGIGVISSLLASSMTKGPLLCVEPNQSLHATLLDNVQSNNPQGIEVRIVGNAIGAAAGSVVFLRHRDHLGSRMADTATDSTDDAERVEVETVTLEQLVGDFPEFALVSDIEGAEAAFIRDPNALKGCTWMCIELHDTSWDGHPCTTEDLNSAVLAHGFDLQYVDGAVRVYARPRTSR